jgi:LuxR family transcriptional regulator, maltose regulon positive regulatory protein
LAAQRTPGAGLVEVVLPILLNELAAQEIDLILVLDDYHLITNDEIHEALAYLVERMPSSFRLVLATREDPPLPLGRLRARGQLAELRAADLRFNDKETSAFLNDALDLGLSVEDIERLQARTEGWPAALYLAALTLRGRSEPSSVIEAFAGDDRHVVDYLTGEVLARQSPELQTFLLRTSILTRLCGPLCDAVTETEASDRILDELERSNLLLIPLDAKRHWYRYHPLFAELLRHELERTEPDVVPALHRSASGWCNDAGLIVEAASHANAAGDIDAAVELVGRHWSSFLDQGQLTTVSRWLDALPASVIADNRMLCFAAAMVTSHMRRLDEAERWLQAADRAPAAADHDGAAAPLEALRAWLRLLRGDVNGTIAAARRAITTTPAALPAQLMLGNALWWAQQLTEAKPLVETASRTAEAAGAAAQAIFILGVHSAIELELGDAGVAENLARDALELTRRSGLDEHPFSATAHIVHGKTHARKGKPNEATAEIERGIQLAERVNAWHTQTYGVLALAEIRHGAHEPAEARRLLARARAIVAALRDADELAGARIEQTERTLRLRRPTRERDTDAAPYWELSERELAVLRLLPSKLSQREIAGELYVSFNTVKTHTRAIFRKLGAASRAEAVARARELGLV